VWTDVTTSLVRDKSGAADYFITVVQDISQRKRTEEELERTAAELRQSHKMEAIGQLAGGVAHDFNNLLSVIRGHSELVLGELRPEDPLREDIEEIALACERAANLTRQLLALSRKQVLAPRFVDVNETAEALSKMLRRLIGEHVTLGLELHATGRVFVDPGQLEQVLINLVVNARDAMPRGGTVTIATSDVAVEATPAAGRPDAAMAWVRLSVTDTGEGMTDAVLAQAFEPFFTTKGPAKGTGLGLSTVFGIVKQSSGEVAVTTKVGKGTTLDIYLPTSDAPGRTSRPAPRRRQGGTESILLVEDDDQVRAVARAILLRAGYEVLEASSGPHAIALSEARTAHIHLLLTDVVMPGMSGRELSERLSEQRPQMKIIFMSGYTDDAIVHHGVLNDGVAFLQKPITLELLLEKVREVLDQ
jgi:two-component system, cell cycle sensor histidine kinase and response regulator CckA